MNKTHLEELAYSQLKAHLDESYADELIGVLSLAFANVSQKITSEIKASEPNLSDHSTTHLRDVLGQAFHLIAPTGEDLTCIELYYLVLAIVFHDVGNYFRREQHEFNISDIYDECHPHPENKWEKQNILRICGAHSGKAPDNTRNTLQFLQSNAASHFNIPMNPQKVAAILRFADELAEGRQRTSDYKLSKNGYSAESTIYHWYAYVTKVDIDKVGSRIVLTYNILVSDVVTEDKRYVSVEELPRHLDFIYHRIIKLDQERRYARHYAKPLQCFSATSASFTFWHNHNEVQLGLESVLLNDLVVPGEEVPELQKRFPLLDPEIVTKAVAAEIKRKNE